MANSSLTPERRAQFLALLSECGNVTRAAEESGANRCMLYQLRAADAEFAEEWEEAARIGAARLEDEARRRAVEGWQEPVWYQGEEVGAVRKYSDTLLICLLKAHHPEKYADRSKADLKVDGSLTHSHTLDLTPEMSSALSWLYPEETPE